MEKPLNRLLSSGHWPLVTAVLLAGAWLLAAGCGGGGGGGAVTNEQKAQVTGLFTGMSGGTEAAAGLEQFSSGISDLYSYIPIARNRATRQIVGDTYLDGEDNVWTITALNPNGSGSASTTWLNGVDTGTVQARVEWSAVTTEPDGDHWSYSYYEGEAVEPSATLEFTFAPPPDDSISVEGTLTYTDPDTQVTYSMSFTMSFPAAGGFVMTMDVTGSDNTHLVGDFRMSADGNWIRVSATFTEPSGYSITTTETITINPGPPETFTMEFTFHDNEGYSGELTLYSDGTGQGSVSDASGQIATIQIAGGVTTITYRDGTSETLEGGISMGRSLKLLKR